MNKIRIVFIVIGIVFLVLTHIGDTNYRDWAYSNQIADFGLANYLPSITGTITAIFLLIGLSKESFTKAPTSAFWIMVGCVIYEVMQPTLGTGIFDWQDFVAVVITGCIVVYSLHLSNKNWLEPQHSKQKNQD
ncbi:hypothetical protein [Shewanella sp. MBTL60-112-B1]|uniref:hypothetical protein n=2 Tax=unclassified Shewanella TaxID=196818 RepID=UPI001BC3FF50|nr:hypothetical protein [Shewanella sp. MBTL60-112-B1]GIU21716.1 hypothetical protein TUM4444_41270 [Shewanella sp. MBTL60-112-B1]